MLGEGGLPDLITGIPKHACSASPKLFTAQDQSPAKRAPTLMLLLR